MQRGNDVSLGARYKGSDNFQEYIRRITADGGTVRNEDAAVTIRRGLKTIYGDLKNHKLIYVAGSEQIRTVGVNSYVKKAFNTAPWTFGPELVVNGGFDTDTGWNKGTGVTIVGGVASFVNTPVGQGILRGVGLQNDKTYEIIFDLVVSSGTLSIYLYGSNQYGTSRNTSGRYKQVITTTLGVSNLSFISMGTFTGSIDNVSVKEIIPSTSSALGPELVVNGGFDTDTSWSKGTGWSISGGVGISNGTQVTESVLSQNPTIKLDSYYQLTVNVVSVSSQFRIYLGGSAYFQLTGVGVASTILKSSGTSFFLTSWAGNVGSIDNLSIKEVLSNDLYQITDASQPSLSGNIAPNEKPCLQNSYGGARYLNHAPISFGANDTWSITSVLNPSFAQYFNICGDIATGSCIRLYANGANVILQFDNTTGATIIYNTIPHYGKNMILTVVYDAINIHAYINGVYVGKNSLTINSAIVFSLLGNGRSNMIPNAKYYSHIIKAGASTASQVLQEHTVLRSIYPEVESVTIGSQTWASSNCDMVTTPQGSIIQEMQPNTAVEKITNIADREFSSDTGWWIITTINISGGALVWNNQTGNIVKANLLTSGKWYKVSGTVSNYTIGTLTFRDGNTSTNLISANGTFNFLIKATGPDCRFAAYVTSAFNLDNVSVQELGWADSTELYDAVYIQTAEAASSVEKITVAADRDFSSDTGFWTKVGAFSIADGVCHLTSAVVNDRLAKNTALIIGRYYRATITISNYSTGEVKINLGSTNSPSYTGNGTYTFYGKANDTSLYIRAYGSSNTLDIDNISIKELGTTGQEAVYEKAALKEAAMWSYYNNDPVLGSVYGKLYNWYAVKLLQLDIEAYNAANPTTPWGWKVPTTAEWNICFASLGGISVASNALRLNSSIYWTSQTSLGTNSSGLSALPGGSRAATGVFNLINAYFMFIDLDKKLSWADGLTTTIYNSPNSLIAGAALRLLKV